MSKLTTFKLLNETPYVTLPSYNEAVQDKVSCKLSDFALFSGALPQRVKKVNNQNSAEYGAVWTTNLFDHHAIFSLTVDSLFNNQPVRKPTLPYAQHVMVAPRFLDPELHGLGTKIAYSASGTVEEHLTLHGEMTYCPKCLTNAYQVRELQAALARDELPSINIMVGHQSSPVTANDEFSPISNQYAAHGNFYRYGGKNYACYSFPDYHAGRMQHYWFDCEPIRVKTDELSGEVQCLDPLFAASYEPVINHTSLVRYLNQIDREYFVAGVARGEITNCRDYRIDPSLTPLGKYLNTGFMAQLELSTKFNEIDQQKQINQIFNQGIEI